MSKINALMSWLGVSIVVGFVFLLIGFLLGTFCNLTFNFYQWSESWRFIVGTFGIIGFIFGSRVGLEVEEDF